MKRIATIIIVASMFLGACTPPSLVDTVTPDAETQTVPLPQTPTSAGDYSAAVAGFCAAVNEALREGNEFVTAHAIVADHLLSTGTSQVEKGLLHYTRFNTMRTAVLDTMNDGGCR